MTLRNKKEALGALYHTNNTVNCVYCLHATKSYNTIPCLSCGDVTQYDAFVPDYLKIYNTRQNTNSLKDNKK